MVKKYLFIAFLLLFSTQSLAKVSDFYRYFTVDMKQEIPNIEDFINKIQQTYNVYDKGYISRFNMGKKFKKEFSQTIRFYGLSEGRLKNNYEDELLEVISWLPKETYQYIGPMLHEVPGMSEKILNLPGIKETKNQFPQDVADKFKASENLEFMSPALYFLLMPELWEQKKPEDLDKPVERPAKKPKIKTDIPDFLKEKMDMPVKTAEKKESSAHKKAASSVLSNFRTVAPTLTSPLTTEDAKAFVATIDDIINWGMENEMKNFSKLINAEILLDLWEQEQGTALTQNSLKDAVNPCQRLVLKTRFAKLYNEFSAVVVKQGFSPEEWAYTCDKTIKAFRVAEANMSVAYAVRYHRRGYYDQYIDKLHSKWRDEMYAVEAAIIKMYAVFKEDVKAIEPVRNELKQKLMKTRGIILTAPIIY